MGPLPDHLAKKFTAGVKIVETNTSLRQKYGSRFSKIEMHFIQGIIQYDPTKRMTSRKCLSHEYFTDLRQQDVQQKQQQSILNDDGGIEEDIDGYMYSSDDNQAKVASFPSSYNKLDESCEIIDESLDGFSASVRRGDADIYEDDFED